MAPVRTGTASQVDASAGSGSVSVTVPADATGAVAFWSNYNSLGTATLSTLTLGGNAFATQAENPVKTPTSDSDGTGVAILTTLPGTGSQTLAWAWSDTDARDEGGGLFIVWIKDYNQADAVRDSGVEVTTGSSTINHTLTTATDDLVLAQGQSFTGTNPATTGTAFVSNVTINSEVYDITEVTPEGDNSTLIQVTGDYPTLACIAIKAGAAAASPTPTYHGAGLMAVS